ncbi:hypothetical protein J4209_02080 [Candidatus Woesearchaeota archaeon]|nr:hypothetical protein [Candidatus Woesearchaeota archaeon]
MTRCPYCGRNLNETERYCWFCEQDVSKIIDEGEKPKTDLPKSSDRSLLDDVKGLFKKIKPKFRK